MYRPGPGVNANGIQELGFVLNELRYWLEEWEVGDLLLARNKDGMPALCVAMQEGNVEAIAAYGQLLRDFPLTPGVRLKLLTSVLGNPSALKQAIKDGRTEAIKAYSQLVKGIQADQHTRLLPEDAKKLLSKLHDIQGTAVMGRVVSNNEDYKRVVLGNPDVKKVFKEAKASLK